MKKLVKILLLMSIMVLACISGASASTTNPCDQNNSVQVEQSQININDLGFTVHDIVKVYTPEEYYKMKSKETGIPVNQIRQMEIQKSEALLEKDGLRPANSYYATLSKTVSFISNNNCTGSLRISCTAYCNFDRIISVNSTGFAAISDGASRFEVAGQSLSAVKVSDYNATVYGPVSVRTSSQITKNEALNLGLEAVGFSQGSGSGYNYYYYKNIDVNCSMQP